MNFWPVLFLFLIAGFLGIITIHTHESALEYSVRAGHCRRSMVRLQEERVEIKTELALIRQPLVANRKAAELCKDLVPPDPDLAAYTEDLESLRRLATVPVRTRSASQDDEQTNRPVAMQPDEHADPREEN